MDDTILSLQNISMSYDTQEVLRSISLDVYKGEFITLLGASGCGKTTTLRIVAGLEKPQAGRIFLEGRDVTALAPEKRNVNTVFQNYALFPHMNVFKNIAYGLTLTRQKKDVIRDRVAQMLRLVQLEGYEKRMPGQLSGGQRQRVAIARAVINNPAILLLDEPLGALDLQLRRQLQGELKSLQQNLGITFIYVTHDQEEALNMSTRIAVMNEGAFEQIGTPEDIYERPRTVFAARFIGQSNILRCEAVQANENDTTASLSGGLIRVAGRYAPGDTLTLSVRAERIDYAAQAGFGFALKGIIQSHSYIGGVLRTTITLGDGTELFVTGANPTSQYPAGCEVEVFWDPLTAAVVGEEAKYA